MGIAAVAVPDRARRQFYLRQVFRWAGRQNEVLNSGFAFDHPDFHPGCRFNPELAEHCLGIGHKPSLEFRVGPGPGYNLSPLFLLKSFLLGHDLSLSKERF